MVFLSHSLRCRPLVYFVTLLSLVMPAASMLMECNGLSNLCSVQVTDAFYAMVHNAMAAVDNGFAFAANHIDDPIVESLTAGYRGLSLDICNCNGQLEFCHGNDIVGCGVGRVDPIQAFSEINDWIIANPNSVLLISLQINEEAGGAISLDMIQDLLQQVPNGWSDRLYDHWPISSEWPTFGELIEANQQVIFFYFQGPNGEGDHFPGLNYWYDFVWATGWEWASLSELESTLLDNCPLTRGEMATGDFFLIESYVTEKALFGLQFLPSQTAAQQINTVEWMGNILDACLEIHGFSSAIVMVDFWSEGNLPTLMQQRNALLVGSPTTVPSPTDPPASPTIAPSTRLPTTIAPSTHISTTIAPSTRIPTTIAPTPLAVENSLLIPTASPTPIPSLLPTFNDTFYPTFNETSYPSLNDTVCTLETDYGELVMIPDGESYGNYLTTRCGSSEDYPCFCNMGQVQCPYCAFVDQASSRLYCARHNETIEYPDGTSYKRCTCEIPEIPWHDPITSCQEIPSPNTNKNFEPATTSSTIDSDSHLESDETYAIESQSSHAETDWIGLAYFLTLAVVSMVV